jgi:hypothetical protein
VRRIFGDQYQTVLKGNCDDHWIGASYRLPSALQIGEDPSGEFGASPIECQEFY